MVHVCVHTCNTTDYIYNSIKKKKYRPISGYHNSKHYNNKNNKLDDSKQNNCTHCFYR